MEIGRVLMVEPTYYDVLHIDNPHQNLDVRPDPEGAISQWKNQAAIVRPLAARMGACIDVLPGTPGLEDQVFVANTGIAWKGKFVKSRFRNEHRQPEADVVEAYFKAQGYETLTLPEGIHFEGTGDLIPMRDDLILGAHGFRSDCEAFPIVQDFLDTEILPFKLLDPRFYHGDTAVARMKDFTALYHPGSISPQDIAKIRGRVPDLIPVTYADNMQFITNGVTIGDTYVVERGKPTPSRAPTLDEIRSRRIEVVEIDTNQFMLAGGSAYCASLMVYQ